MGSKAGEVWKFLVPVIPSGGEKKKKYRCASSVRREANGECPGEDGGGGLDMRTVQAEIAAVGARVTYIEEQVENIKSALPALDCKIPSASLGMPTSSLSLEEMQHLKRIHFQLLHFWEDLSRQQLEKLGFLSDCLQVLEEQGIKSKVKDGEKPKAAEESYKEFEQHVCEKVISDLRKNQALEMKLYLDRISGVPDPNKPLFLPQSPPERGPQGVASQQLGLGKKSTSTHELHAEREPHMVPCKMKMGPGPQNIAIARVPRCREGASPASTPVPEPTQIPSSIEV